MTYPITQLVQDAIIRIGCSKVEAAELCDLPQSTMYALASGERGAHPSIATLKKLAAGLSIPLDDLLAATGRSQSSAKDAQTRQEKAHLAVLRQLSDRDRRVVLTLAKELHRT